MKIKIRGICPECADTYDTTVEVKDPGVGSLDTHLLDIDVSDARCVYCMDNLDEEDAVIAQPKISWEKI